MIFIQRLMAHFNQLIIDLKLHSNSSLDTCQPCSTKVFLFLACTSLLTACQQTQIDLTQSEPPKLAPALEKINKGSNTNKTQGNMPSTPRVKLPVTNNLTQIESIPLKTANGHSFLLHLFPQDKTKVNQLNLVAISPQEPYQNIDILAISLRESLLHNAANSDLECIESLKSNASMHTMNMSIRCPSSISLARSGQELIKFWLPQGINSLDTDKIARTVKLNKHIGAFSGSEIEKLWRKIILGKGHPYNQALDQSSVVGSLSNAHGISALKALQQHAITQSQWHLLATKSADLSNQQTQSIALMSQLLDNQKSNNRPQRSTSTSAVHPNKSKPLTEQESINTTKTLYLIDAPDTVQTQVRIGYRLDNLTSSNLSNKEKQLGCQSLAALLGRSYSGRLFYDLREQRGLTYGIYASCLQAPLSTTFKIRGSTQLQHTGAFLSGVLDHLNLLKEQTASQQELNSVTTYLTGREILAIDSPSAIRSRYIRQFTRPTHHISQKEVLTALDKLSPEKLQQLAQSQFSAPPHIILRGDAEKIIPDIQQKLPSWKIKVTQVQ